MKIYSCQVDKQDTLVAYEADNEVVNKFLLALVMENRHDGRKVSVLLSPDDVHSLLEQMTSFLSKV